MIEVTGRENMSYYPPFATIIAGTDRNSLLSVKRSLRSIIPNIVGFVFATILVAIVEYYFYDVESPQIPLLRHLSVRWLCVIPILFLLEIFRRYHNDLYVFSDHRLTHHGGRLALSYSVPMINYADVRGINVDQGIFGRILDYGRIEIGTAAMDGSELIMMGVRAPIELAALVDEFRTYSRSKRKEELNTDSNQALSSESD